MESLDTLNTRLIDEYGIDSDTGKPMFRIVWANDQLEMRNVKFTDSGIELLYPSVVEVKKYPYLKDLYLLERLVVVPEESQKELPVKLSYEPLWAFRDHNDFPLPPIWPAAKFVIDTMYAALGKAGMAHYVDSEENTTPEGREQRIDKLQAELFGNETEAADAMRYHEGVVVPTNYKKKES